MHCESADAERQESTTKKGNNEIKLTAEQKAKIENNRQRALLLREKKRKNLTTNDLKILELKQKIGNSIDSGAGFLIEVDADDGPSNKKPKQSTVFESSLPEITDCEICSKQFDESFLKTNFDFSVCDTCRDPKDKHTLITRTDAKTNYILKDCDLDRREPPLRYISKRNPNQKFSNDMKLYLQVQVEQRALDVWGSEERLMEEIESRREKKIARKEKEFKKNITKLRMEMQSNLYKRKIKTHEHEFGDERYDEGREEYFKECESCDHVVYYEKM